jgi:hypothetical protein
LGAAAFFFALTLDALAIILEIGLTANESVGQFGLFGLQLREFIGLRVCGAGRGNGVRRDVLVFARILNPACRSRPLMLC